MTKFLDILYTAQVKALQKLREHGIYSLDAVNVHLAKYSTESYCLGYAPEDPIEITVAGMRLFEALISKRSREDLTEFLVHEYGHAFLFQVWNTRLSKKERKEFVRLFGDYDSDGEGYKHRISDTIRGLLHLKPRGYDTTKYVSLYASTSPHEDWAETFAFLVCGKVAKTSGKKTVFVERLIDKYGR